MNPRCHQVVHVATAAFCITIGAAVAGCSGRSPSPPIEIPNVPGPALPARVREVVDGDTLEIEFGDGNRDRVRLLGIDTPETVDRDRPVECFGPEASARTKSLLPSGTRIGVQRDLEARDRYGRLLVYLWRRADGLFVNASLVRDGFARTLSIPPNVAHRSELSAAAAEARSAELGLWARCEPEGGG